MRLKDLLLNEDDGGVQSKSQLQDLLRDRIEEGAGEILFDVGIEDNGDPMLLSKEEWDAALARIQKCAQSMGAEIRILMTRNVGGEFDAGSTQGPEDKSCSGKILIRRIPQNLDDVIETRIAVVGNGKELVAAESLAIIHDS